MSARLRIRVDRAAATSLTEQISQTIRAAILERRLAPGARLPSWRDLAVQLGVARGTVRAAYERLIDEMLIVASGPAGSHVAELLSPPPAALAPPVLAPRRQYPVGPLPFQMGLPAEDGFPVKLWSRIVGRAARSDTAAPVMFPDPCGTLELRAQIAGYLALARGIRCVPDQVFITRGYRDGLNLAIRALRLEGRTAWMEEPGYGATRAALRLAGIEPIPVQVDAHGLRVQDGVALAPDAALAVVTAGQQAPLGVPLSSSRRRALLRWAAHAQSWILEDDYLSELQLRGRAAPALMAMDPAGRVIYAGTFSKTLAPSVGVGFVVVPTALVARFVDVATCLAPAPNAVTQLAVAAFLRDGHYLRHLRRMKLLYAARRDALRTRLAGLPGTTPGSLINAGLAVLLRLPAGSDDAAIAREARGHGLMVGTLSTWYATDSRMPGLLLGITNLGEPSLAPVCDQLVALVASWLER